MITNERQYLITGKQLSKLTKASQEFNLEAVAKRTGSGDLAKAELNAMKSEIEVLSFQLREYEGLKSGAITVLKAASLDELPGILIRARIARGLTQAQLAQRLDLKEQQIQRYESEEYASASIRRLAEVAKALHLNISEVAELQRTFSEAPLSRPMEIDWRLFPVAEMYRRNWFEGFSGSLKEAKTEAELLVQSFVKTVFQRPATALHRKRVRSGSSLDEYALLAWECRILVLAKQSPPEGVYVSGSLDERWFRTLVQESRYPDGPRRAKKRLDAAGISLVIEPHLSHTHLDGAAFLHDGRPVIGLSLRYDRLDNFWFVLFHELIHITRHLRRNKVESIFDDIEAAADELEQEADKLAGNMLIPDDVWEMALARYVRSKESVDLLASKLKISPTIIAGRIRNEANNFVILSDMIGQGEVRKHFPEAGFGQ